MTGSSAVATAGEGDLSWMRTYVGKPATSVVNDPRFTAAVSAYLPHVPVPMGGSSTADIPAHAAQSTLNVPLDVEIKNGFVTVAGCLAHSCGESAVLVLANTDDSHPSLILAFATQKLNDGGHASPPVLMKLYIYFSDKSTQELSPELVSIFHDWLRDSYVDHIDQTLIAASDGFTIVPTPKTFKSISLKSLH
jgi:hypothetical protein